MFAHFKLNPDGEKQWTENDESSFPTWFKKYYSSKIRQK